MKLKDRRLAPVGGYFFDYEIDRNGVKTPMRVTSSDGGLDKLIERVKKDMGANKVPVPLDLEWQIENQICERQPDGRCWAEKNRLGDVVAAGVQAVAGVADQAIKIFTGKKGTLKKKAKDCPGCKKRKARLNKIGH